MQLVLLIGVVIEKSTRHCPSPVDKRTTPQLQCWAHRVNVIVGHAIKKSTDVLGLIHRYCAQGLKKSIPPLDLGWKSIGVIINFMPTGKLEGQRDGICDSLFVFVANHTSMIDFIVLEKMTASSVMEKTSQMDWLR
ncbi:unnamed protein product [Lactuca virosa]|uniref:Uncharacterized protein n=1 Tax=Lactuca virosa TaxID=75947 RepID=A0AAU9M933_9ASTR|nr:unnamed protein product [Lactuca virosa]